MHFFTSRKLSNDTNATISELLVSFPSLWVELELELELVQIKAIQMYAFIQNFGSAALKLTLSNYLYYFYFNNIISPINTKSFQTSIQEDVLMLIFYIHLFCGWIYDDACRTLITLKIAECRRMLLSVILV